MSKEQDPKRVQVTSEEVVSIYEKSLGLHSRAKYILSDHFTEAKVLPEITFELVCEMLSSTLFLRNFIKKSFPNIDDPHKTKNKAYSLSVAAVGQLAKATLILEDINKDLIKQNIHMELQ